MQQNRELLSEIQNSEKPSFVETDILRAHKGIAKQLNLKQEMKMLQIQNLQ